MNALARWCRPGRLFLVGGVICLAAGNAAAQAVGAGPLTTALANTEPLTGVIRLGSLRLAPGLTIKELGTDDNVFDEALDPKRDRVIAGTPDVSLFTRTRFLQLAGYLGSDMQYYHKYKSERSVGLSYKGRADVLLGRLTPFVGAGKTSNRTRANGEIDVRADLQINELSYGIAYDLSAHAKFFVAAVQTDTDFRDAFQSGVSLDQSLSRRETEYMVGVRTELTPLLRLETRGSVKRDRFSITPSRDGESYRGEVALLFDPAAVISGSASLGYDDYTPVDPLVAGFRGLSANGGLTYRVLEIGRLNVAFNRGRQYSFDIEEAYYILNGGFLSWTQRLFGEVDLQVQASRSVFDYGERREGSPKRTETLDMVNGNVGYNLRNKTRVALNYELDERRSPALPSRNFFRRRIFLSWLVAF